MVVNIQTGERNYHTQINSALYSAYNAVISGLDINVINNMDITLNSGSVIYKGSKIDLNSTTLTLSQGDNNYPRIDLIVYDGNNITVLEGTPSSDPKPSSYDPNDVLVLYQVYVELQTTVINQSDIKDLRVPFRIAYIPNIETDVDLNQNQLINVVAHKSSTYPSTPVEGQLFYKTDDKRYYIYNGTEWLALGSNVKWEEVNYDTSIERDKGYVVKPLPWDISVVVYRGSSPELAGTGITDVYITSDGKKMFVLADGQDSIYQYTLKKAWDITTAVYDGKSFSVGNEEDIPTGFTFKPDGTKLYVVGYTNLKIYQYTLSTPWDISTASYDSVNNNLNQDSGPVGIVFSSDGSKLFMAGNGADAVYQYSLTTPWDVSTLSYDSITLDASAQDNGIRGLCFNSDGTKLYLAGSGNDKIYQYTLSTPWSLLGASYDNKSIDVSTDVGNPSGVVVNPEGTRFFVSSLSNNYVHQYYARGPILTLPSSLEKGDTFRIISMAEGTRISLNTGQLVYNLGNTITGPSEYVEIDESNSYLELVSISTTELNVTAFYKNKVYSLSDLSNVNINSPVDGQGLVYSSGTWINRDIATQEELDNVNNSLNNHLNDTNNPHQTNLSNLTDTQITTPTDGEGLVYDSGSWKNIAVATQTELDNINSTLTNHINDTNIHFTQVEISITKSQVSDFVETDYVHTTGNEDINDTKRFNGLVAFTQEMSASSAIDWNQGNKQSITLTGDVTLTFTDPAGPCNLILKIVQDSVGGHNVTFPANVKWEGGSAPDLSSDTGGSIRIVTLYFDGSDYYAQITDSY